MALLEIQGLAKEFDGVTALQHVTLEVRERRFPAVTVRVGDEPTWRRVSDAFKAKYRGSGAVRVMVRAEVEPMTLALEPKKGVPGV